MVAYHSVYILLLYLQSHSLHMLVLNTHSCGHVRLPILLYGVCTMNLAQRMEKDCK